jgi:exonuclease SbcC
MIEAVQLQNFISHGSTDIRLDNGLTLFIGHNGAGKSSIIDAITFALYGQHTRKSNKNLVKRGSSSTRVEIEVSVRGRKFKIVRGLNELGQLINAKLTEIGSDGPIDIVVGERRQFGESVSEEVSKIIGLDYSKLRVAAVVQQGELNSIIQAQPKEFKELVNSLFGLDRLDIAFQSMKDLIQSFRDEIRKKIGYDDSNIFEVKHRLEDARKAYEDARNTLEELKEQKTRLQDQITELDDAINEFEPLHLKVKELESRETDLLNYVRQEAKKLEEQVSDSIEMVSQARKYLLVINERETIKSRLYELQTSLLEIDPELERVSNNIGRIKALIEVSGKLQIVDGKCPICKSPVSKIDEIYDVAHLKKELSKLNDEQKKLTSKKESLREDEGEYRKKELEINNAEAFLQNNRINSIDDVTELEKAVSRRQETLSKIRVDVRSLGNPEEVVIDDYSRKLAEQILDLRKELRTFNQAEYEHVKAEHRKLLTKDLPDLEARIGEYRSKAEQAQEECKLLESAVKELDKAYEYVKILEKIRTSVYNRDGVVGTSLRTWALKTISEKASEYTAMFNMSISRLQLTEKARDISIECFGRSGVIDLESLSGGEKVAIALALRLGMAYVMGSGRLDFVILDEPTAHLDEERRKSLVRIITEAFRSGLGPLAQMILITHDSEIFENAEADSVYKFAMTNEGTCVTQI